MRLENAGVIRNGQRRRQSVALARRSAATASPTGSIGSRPFIREAWGRGIVHIKLIGDLPVGSGTLAEARKAAGYLCKYIGKGLDDERRRVGLHRYEVAQGFQPERIHVYGSTDDDAIARASEYMVRAPETIG